MWSRLAGCPVSSRVMHLSDLATVVIGVPSAVAAVVAAVVAVRSARTADSAARDVSASTGIEMARRHDELDPMPDVTWWRDSTGTDGGIVVCVSSRTQKEYRLRASSSRGRWERELSTARLPAGGQATARLPICRLNEELPDLVKLGFDPPQPCPCGKPHGDKEGHWSYTLRVPPMDQIEPWNGPGNHFFRKLGPWRDPGDRPTT